MSLVTGALGLFGFYVLSTAGGFVADTYDGPLMAINFARSASLDFTQMDKELLRRNLVPAAERDAIDGSIDRLATTFFEDLAVAEERSMSGDERTVIAEIRQLVQMWNTLRTKADADDAARELDVLAERVIDRFDHLIELTVDQSFVQRRQTLSAVAAFRTTSIVAIVLALLLSAGVTLLLARRIVRPLAAAAAVADRIARGELETVIPEGGADETGALLRSMAVMQDNIRATMDQEKAQRRSAQNRLIAALESSHEAMVLVGPDGRAVIANSQLTAFFPPLARQLDSDDNFATIFRELGEELITRIVIPGERAAPHPPDWSDLLAAGGEFRLSDGRWLRASRSSTQDGGYFLVLSDITDIKEREQRLREAKSQAEAASEAKSKFLANMSHELRTPLNAIIGFAEILSGQAFGALGNPRYLEYSADILRSGRHLLDVITSVLDVAKSEAGRLQIDARPTELASVFDDCTAMIRDQCGAAELRLIVKSPPAGVTVRADAPKLRQIILNLLSNAVKFTEPGGTVWLEAGDAGDAIKVRIADSGIGMSPEHVAIALTPFSQVDNRLARRYEGAGLGLPLTKALVELHGGTLNIVSRLGEGTEVTFLLSRATAGAGSSRPADTDASQAGAHQSG